MENLRASDLKKIFVNWSQGTLYNRFDTLNIKDNKEYIARNVVTGIDFYNKKAVDLLKIQYVKEFPAEENKIDKVIVDYVSNKSNADKTRGIERKQSKKTDNNDNVDNNDKIQNVNNVNNINAGYIKENYILKELHEEIVSSLKKQVEILQSQLEKETANNEKLVDTIRLREQKDVVIEQQNLVKLQNDVKLIADTTEDVKKERKGRGIFALFRNVDK